MGICIWKGFLVRILLFCCICLFSGSDVFGRMVDNAKEHDSGKMHMEYENEEGGFDSDLCSRFRYVRIYINTESYVTIDLIFVVIWMVLVFIVVMVRRY